MFLVRHERFVFKNELKITGCCDVDMLDDHGQTIVVFTEIRGNPGPSVTNAIECIISQYSKIWDLQPGDTLFIERYEQHPLDLDVVHIVNKKPIWNRLPQDQANSILAALEI